MYRSVKTKRTLFTEEKIANLHKNIEKFDWAKAKKAEILEKAEFYLALGADRIALDMANEKLKRSFAVNEKYGCPHCGMKMMRYSNYGWIIDAEKHPWKIQCPACGRLYPSNDFEAFYRSGQDEHGDFSYDRADRSLLVNELYPEMGEGFAVDDGSGWLKDPSDPEFGRYSFIPYYVFMGMWKLNQKMCGNYVSNAMESLSYAYLLTGDRKYGDPAAMLMGKMAYLYPKMDCLDSPWHLGYRQCHGGSGLGRFIGRIWDTGLVRSFAKWYDMVFPCMDDALAAYIRENPVRYFGEAPESGADFIAGLDQNLMLQVYPDKKALILDCNPGPPHAMLVETALVLQRDDLFEEYAEFACTAQSKRIAGTHWQSLMQLITNRVTREGFAGEVSPGYNSMWSNGFVETAQLLKGSKYDPYQNVKFVKLGDMVRNYAVCDGDTLCLGDAKACGNPGLSINLNNQALYFLETGDLRDAALIAKAAGDGPICTDWFIDCEAVDQKIREAAAKHGPFRSESRCLPQFGLAAIESHPEGKEPEAVTIWCGQNFGHSHRDTMNLNVFGFGIDMMPDHGYPDFANANFTRFRWTSNMISHNTAMIPQERPFTKEEQVDKKSSVYMTNIGMQEAGKFRHFLADDKVSVICAEAPNLYDDTFSRAVAAIDLDGKSRYLVDIFDVGGKGDQRLSYHAVATNADVSVFGTEFVPQNGGTYAGENVAYKDDAYSAERCDGFNYLTDVRRSHPSGAFSVDWKCFDNWHVWDRDRNVHLKLHVLSDVKEAALCHGQPPQTKKDNPENLSYLILKNGEGTARFVNILEPYEDAAFIASCEATQDGDTVTVTVTHTGGRIDTVTIKKNGTALRVAVESTTGYHMTYGDTVLCGEVVDFTRELAFENYAVVRLDGDIDAASLVGKFMDIETNVEPNAFYEIKSAEALGNGLWKLGTGDCTFIKCFLDDTDKDKGYLYFVKEGAAVRITM